MATTEPIRAGSKIVAVGRNYVAHVSELGNTVPKVPMLFFKPWSCVIHEPAPIEKPSNVTKFHHEVELAVVIGKKAKRVAADSIMDHVAGYAVALDMTARDFQESAKAAGIPWTLAKGLDTWCPLGPMVPAADVPDPHALDIWLTVDGEERQRANTRDMIFNIPTLLEFINRRITLEEGDVVLTGTPEGVGPVEPGQTIHAGIAGIGEIKFGVVEIDA